jgi:hypothetical protein
MTDRGRTYQFDLEKRSRERARENTKEEHPVATENGDREREARALSDAIQTFYGARFPGHFEQSLQLSTVTLTKSGGGSALKIEVLGDDKYKLSGGSGPGGFGADVAVNMSEVSKEEMEDTLEDWFRIATV